jgi:serine/threonine protein kinase
VFLTMSGLIKLGDFGFSREYDQTVSGDVGKTVCGTPYYLAPELWNSARYGLKADMWSLGVVLYELMALRKPFSGNTMRQLVGNVLEGNIDELPTHYSVELRTLCTDLLSLDPEKRPSVPALFQRSVLRVQGLETLAKNVPRLVTVPERIRSALLQDVKDTLAAPPEEE